jgi:tyrosyl-DNA phosphodiesterase 2
VGGGGEGRERRRGVSRLSFVSEYQRGGLGVDLVVRRPGGGEGGEGESVAERDLGSGEKVFRIVNVHLDSMASNPPMRPLQMAAVGRWAGSEECAAGIVAGDMNANRVDDRMLPQENGFKDAYLELGGVEDAEEGMTWGYQSEEWMAKRFEPKRLDKVLFCGGVEVKSLVKIGVGVQVEDEALRARMRAEGNVEYVTDHYGLMAEFSLEEGVEFAVQSEETILGSLSGTR